MPYAFTTTATLSAAPSTTFTWAYIDPSHIVATKDGSPFDLSDSTITRNRDTGVTTVTFASNQSGVFTFRRETPVPTEQASAKEATDGKYASSLRMGTDPDGRALLYMLQEALDRIEALENA